MNTLLRYQPQQTIERRYSSSSSSSPTHEYPHCGSKLTQSNTPVNPHYQYLQSLYHDKERELQHVQQILATELDTVRQQDTLNAIKEVFYNSQRQMLLQWEIDATNELHALKEKLDSYTASHMHVNAKTYGAIMQHSPLSDTSSSSSSSSDDD